MHAIHHGEAGIVFRAVFAPFGVLSVKQQLYSYINRQIIHITQRTVCTHFIQPQNSIRKQGATHE